MVRKEIFIIGNAGKTTFDITIGGASVASIRCNEYSKNTVKHGFINITTGDNSSSIEVKGFTIYDMTTDQSGFSGKY